MKKIFALLAVATLCSFAIRPDKVQRRKGILINEGGRIIFKELEGWQDYEIKATGDTTYQFKIS